MPKKITQSKLSQYISNNLDNNMNGEVGVFNKKNCTCEPALNAKNPNISINPPRDVRGIECPAMYLLSLSLNRSSLGPRTYAPIMVMVTYTRVIRLF